MPSNTSICTPFDKLYSTFHEFELITRSQLATFPLNYLIRTHSTHSYCHNLPNKGPSSAKGTLDNLISCIPLGSNFEAVAFADMEKQLCAGCTWAQVVSLIKETLTRDLSDARLLKERATLGRTKERPADRRACAVATIVQAAVQGFKCA